MNRSLAPLFTLALLGAAGASQADPAIYQNGTLTVPAGAIFTNSRQQYFTDIVLDSDSAGKLTIVSATRMPLTYVDSVEAVVDEGPAETFAPTVTLEVAGNKSVPCVALLEPAVSRNGDTFTVLLAETQMGPEETCAQMLDPFEIEIPLDVSGLEGGPYKVVVNDEAETSFDLPYLTVDTLAAH